VAAFARYRAQAKEAAARAAAASPAPGSTDHG
jgi:hypothetical protein